ncbi:4-hydroxybenzoate octaprenyltransferase [Alysiella crassa]|uniref:4-hydroxybenzoate octaprenyltransferase n=1 Tax=Alysiella crassa TaxID=153491 RepID=A0A376BLG6_9NEIS|nr:4-hydroxybenzoate octaprenyltransferase [Alysiella crassa]UOP07707.1 4-hydroxybenzoate octaprenyltransferase [Alysiella crassa]SSY70054.1 4-hydroxybenzoate octaprenyltransferase [Alysiella crassa]
MKIKKLLSQLMHPRTVGKLTVYAQLMRIDRPIGTLLLLYPTIWAIWIASNGKPDWLVLLMFTIGTFLMRSAGCVINDWADREYDGHVARTKNRPAARGLVSKKEAYRLTGFLCGLAALCLIPFNYKTWMMAIPAVFLALSYPYMKRFMPLPQAYLGLAFSFGIPMAFLAILGDLPTVAWWLFAANVFWTLAYDTIYAMADKEDDLKIGIKTSAITFGKYDAEMAMLSYALFDVLMIQVGMMIGSFWVYWLMLLMTIYTQWKFYLRIQKRDRQACFDVFLDNTNIGLMWFLGIVMHYSYV